MKLPFSTQQFLKIFEEYNLYMWPLQLAFYLLAIFAILLSLHKLRRTDRLIAGILSFFWIWMGIVYHLVYFSSINQAAIGFGIIFILQGILFLYFGVFKKQLSFAFSKTIYGITGSLFFVYALVIYPLLGNMYGHTFPSSASIGLPCPTTIFTFGMLLWADRKLPAALLIIPALWAIIGFSAAFSLGIKEDIGLMVSFILFILLNNVKNRSAQIQSV